MASPIKQIFYIKKLNNITIQTISSEDIELLRKWKNKNRNNFFYKRIISKKDQLSWFQKYTNTKDNYIFIIKKLDKKIGCIGFRLIENYIDIYNVILDNKKFEHKGLMSLALQLMCSFIMDKYENEITLKVLSNNPTVNWYKKNCFKEIYSKDDYIFMMLDKNNFKKINYELKYLND